MKSLGARLAILLVASIVGVVLLAGFITIRFVGRWDDGSFEASFVRQAEAISVLAGGSTAVAAKAGLDLGPRPPENRIEREDSDRLREAAERMGIDIVPLVEVKDTGVSRRRIAIPIDGASYAYMPFPGPPPQPVSPLVTYLAILIVGAVAISTLAARRILEPLKLLERAVASVGPQGDIPRIDEKGPAEVRATAAALNRLSDRLKLAVDSRMRLVAAAGHDLRTPMTRMRLRAEFLPPEEQETWLKDLAELDRIADSAIRLVREEVAGGDESAAFALDALIGEIAGELREIGRDVTEALPMPRIDVDGRRFGLKRALRNLVDNAATHGGGARVRLGEAEDVAIVEIDDDGPGIPEDLLSRVFEPFFRVDASRRQAHPGAGLGFAIAREIVEGAGGSIAIANRTEGGLRQTVRLPLSQSPSGSF
ncbi:MULTISPECIES: ATP-binding protein [unclassified Aureimonas]|uniref:ATP-binding protein n=1 Tax=unclassified Aureimonas TaxID=2615206 RepID=UPI0006F64A50|nr:MULTISPECIES: ATP-binding protein [unclassified Aureimonas]KQT52785.1 hypothetical protein ASG62_12700 [Aureimonas sp. Leaf427]KQT80244.1 hypothetical protein ASG54_06550 [Aureimonas sp. Leaf460]